MAGIEQEFQIKWCGNKEEILQAINLFIENVDPEYISHGEVQSGRAVDFKHWSPDLVKVLEHEFNLCFEKEGEAGAYKLAVAYINNKLSGLIFIQIVKLANQPYAILQDMVIAKKLRGKHLGKNMLAWIEGELKETGIKLLFLETGIHNQGAHAFFEANHFYVSSKIMVKEIG